jgi:diguanylate cyclase (GGDEF)-like protein
MTTQSERAAVSRMNMELAGILRCLRRESRADKMMAAGLNAIMAAVGADGVAVIGGVPEGGEELAILHRAGAIGQPAATAHSLLTRALIGTPAHATEPNGRPLIAAICRDGGDDKLGLLLWRRRGARIWAAEDVPLVDAIAGIVWLLMDREESQREFYRSTPIDPLTALLNQRTFVAEATRHIARLDRDDLPGTLMLADVDNLDGVAQKLGPDGGDQVLRRAAMLLRSAVRPTDLVGRIGETEFAVWLSGADHLTAAERAEDLCLEAPGKIVAQDSDVPEVSFSIGIASRQAGETFTDLSRRARQAMRQVKREGGGYWRVSLPSTV